VALGLTICGNSTDLLLRFGLLALAQVLDCFTDGLA
jgi:hypothetical protein